MHRHELADHGDAFHACAVLTQLAMNMGEPLFSCGYKDLPFNNLYEVDDDEEENDGEDNGDL